MLLLAHLLTTNWEWHGTTIRILRVVENEAGREPAVASLRKLATDARLEAQTEAIVSRKPFAEVLRAQSIDATCMILGFELPGEDMQEEWHATYDRLFDGMPTAILISSQGGEDILA
jgi:hypothetical protein